MITPSISARISFLPQYFVRKSQLPKASSNFAALFFAAAQDMLMLFQSVALPLYRLPRESPYCEYSAMAAFISLR